MDRPFLSDCVVAQVVKKRGCTRAQPPSEGGENIILRTPGRLVICKCF